MNLPSLDGWLDQIDDDDVRAAIGEVARAEVLLKERLRPPRAEAASPRGRRCIKPEEAAERLSMSRSWVYANLDKLEAIHIGGAVRIPEDAIDRFVDAAA